MPSLTLEYPELLELNKAASVYKKRARETAVQLFEKEVVKHETPILPPDDNVSVIQTRYTFFPHALKDDEPFSKPVNFPWTLHDIKVQQLIEVGYVIVAWDIGKKYSLTLTYKRFNHMEVPTILRRLLQTLGQLKLKSEHKYYNKEKDPYIVIGLPPTIDSSLKVFNILQFSENLFFTWSFFESVDNISKEWAEFATKRKAINLYHQENTSEWWDKSIQTKRNMMSHQKAGIMSLINIPNFALLWEPGTAKTATTIVAIQEKIKRGMIKKAIVVCPGVVREQWRDETISFSNLSPCVIYSNINDLWETNDDIYIMSYDRMRLSSKEIISFVGDDIMLVLDESTAIKNYTKRTKSILKMGRRTRHKVILTGTPITESLKNIFFQWLFLDGGEEFGYTSKSFIEKYFFMSPSERRLKPYDGSAEEIGEKMFKRSLRFRKDEVTDIPPKSYRQIYCTMTNEQKDLYGKVTNQIETEINTNAMGSTTQTISAPIILTAMLRTRQIVNGHVGTKDTDTDKTDVVIFENNPKADVLDELMNESIDSGLPTIIWGCFQPDINLFIKLLQKKEVKGYSVVRGGMTPAAHYEECRKFQETKESLFLLANIKTLKFGKNLHRASRVIYFCSPWSLEARGQSEDRAHRIGQTRKVEYIDILMSDSIDISILKTQQGKKDMVYVVNRDNLSSIMRGDVEL